jgi:hypothetical protein
MRSQQEKFKLANEFVANGRKTQKHSSKYLQGFLLLYFTCLHGRCVRESRRPFAQGFFFFVANFRHLATKKTKGAGEFNKGIF